MTGPQIFALFWGVLAFGLGFLFARYPDVVVSLEVPRRSLAAAGVGPRERIGPMVEAARALLGQAATGRGEL